MKAIPPHIGLSMHVRAILSSTSNDPSSNFCLEETSFFHHTSENKDCKKDDSDPFFPGAARLEKKQGRGISGDYNINNELDEGH